MQVVYQHTSAPAFLIINPFGIGDVLFTTPLVRTLRLAFPKARLAYLCNRRTERILSENPHLKTTIVYEKDEQKAHTRRSRLAGLRYFWQRVQAVRAFRPDWVVDLTLGSRYSFIMRLLGLRKLIGFNYKKRGRFLSASIAIDGYHDAHVIAYTQRLLRFMGIRDIEPQSELHVKETHHRWAEAWLAENCLAAKPLVGMIPAGGVSWGRHASYRRWRYEGFAAVADHLIEKHGAQLLFLGEPADKQSCDTVASLMRQPVVNACGETSLEQFIALLARLDLLVCNDGGPLHLAVSQQIKTVSIFGPVDPVVYGPYPRDPSRHISLFHESLPCRPCYHRFRLPPCPYDRACLSGIETEAVIQAVDRLLSGKVMMKNG